MNYIRNIWYVAAWSHELDGGAPIGRTIAGEPVVLFRKSNGEAVVFEDRCPHRHAPLSLGRVEGDELRCMYHGLKFASDGACIHVPASASIPPNARARVYPVVERWSWLWVWMGDVEKADPALIPDAYGLDNPDWSLQSGALDYAADYQLINDNLCDLSHLDFVHETTLGVSTGSRWSVEQPKVTPIENGLFVERWFTNRAPAPGSTNATDSWSRYRYLLPGLFIQRVSIYPAGTAKAFNFEPPDVPPMSERADQQAVTPIGPGRARYLYAGGVSAAHATPKMLEGMFAVTQAAFAEDKQMIEAQQRIWDKTPEDRPKVFIPQDKAPSQFRRLIARRIAEEQQSASLVEASA